MHLTITSKETFEEQAFFGEMTKKKILMDVSENKGTPKSSIKK